MIYVLDVISKYESSAFIDADCNLACQTHNCGFSNRQLSAKYHYLIIRLTLIRIVHPQVRIF